MPRILPQKIQYNQHELKESIPKENTKFLIKNQKVNSKVNPWAHVSESNKSSKIRKPIRPRVQPYQIYQILIQKHDSNPQIKLSKSLASNSQIPPQKPKTRCEIQWGNKIIE